MRKTNGIAVMGLEAFERFDKGVALLGKQVENRPRGLEESHGGLAELEPAGDLTVKL